MKRLIFPVLAAGLAGAMLPLSGSPAVAAPADDFGYSSLTVATPVRIEIYEPTIPIPATPQAEVYFGYSKVVADSTSSRGRASFFWPGDAVGEGAKTILENLGLPAEVVAPVAEQGYPVQVNSTYPSGPETEKQEPFPGTVMRTTAKEKRTVAQNGYSSQCSFDDTGDGEGGEGGGEPSIPGLPEVPGLPDLPLPLLDLLGLDTPTAASNERSTAPASRKQARSASTSAAEEEEACQIPAQLSALVSFGGYASTTRSERTAGEIESVSTSAVGGIKLLAGIIEVSGVTSKAVASSNGSKPAGNGKSSYGTMTIAGQEFTMGPDGVEGGGQNAPIPGLPDDPAKALKELGVTITVPKPVFEKDGKELKSTVEGLIVEIDSATLSAALRQLPLQDIIGQLPDEAKDLKKVLQAGVNLSPRFVVHLGYASSKVETAEPIQIPDVVPDNDPGTEETETETAGGTNASTGGTGSGGLGASTPGGTTGGSTAGGGADNLAGAELASGLPPLFSIPTLLFVVALGGALIAGSYMRRVGALALGSGAACSHGLDSGLPDLRKIQ